MLTDTALRNLKPKSKIYKASDRDDMYVTVSPPVPSPSATTAVSTGAAQPSRLAATTDLSVFLWRWLAKAD